MEDMGNYGYTLFRTIPLLPLKLNQLFGYILIPALQLTLISHIAS